MGRWGERCVTRRIYFYNCGRHISVSRRVVPPKFDPSGDGGALSRVCDTEKTFRMECNTCVYSLDVTGYSCTKNKCPEFDATGDGGALTKVCTPEHKFKRGCNNCECNLDGTDYVCTKRKC
ncbi:uncharacterized protein LOC143910033 [Arctopsyche grandis]|uniref:uncharacterized protein LOC143910033 n=1 Tax=Arctopsyche grandis TaxID=121162 RepID=UPI00406D9515